MRPSLLTQRIKYTPLGLEPLMIAADDEAMYSFLIYCFSSSYGDLESSKGLVVLSFLKYKVIDSNGKILGYLL